MEGKNQLFESYDLTSQDFETQNSNIRIEDVELKNEKKTTSILGTAVTGLVFTITVVFSFVGFVLSLISVVRGMTKKKTQKYLKVKGLSLSIVSLIISVIIMIASVVVPILFWEDIAPIVKKMGVTDVIPIETSGNQTDLCLQIEKSLSYNEIDKAVTLSAQLQQPLTAEEKNIVMTALVQRINNRIPSFVRSFGSTECLISNDIIREVNKYIKITNNIGISSADDTNVDDYLTQVYNLKEYKKYNDYWVYYYATLDDWNSANQYWGYACDSYSDYMRNQHLSKALNYFSSCLSSTYDYSSSSFGIIETRNFLQIYVDKINYYYSTGNDMSIDYTVVNEYENATDEFFRETNNFVDKIESLPISVYYG